MCCDGEVNGIHPPALLRAIYESRELYVREVLPGIFPFVDWLPVGDKYFRLPGRELGQPLSYKSCGLARRLGLRNLHIAFSGYWPERGANLVTRSFKEFEVQASICRFLASCPEGEIPPLIVASAGNTGNAYNFMTSLLGLPLYLVVPESALEHLRLPIQASARVVAVQGDYTDSIRVAEQLKPMLRAQTDGGIRNVGRRAGMGVVYLNAVLHPSQGTHRLFDHYFQAIGSGSGAIGTWEAVENLLRDGRFGNTRTRIHVAQNEPFTPVPDAWEQHSVDLIHYGTLETSIRVASVTASVLANRTPAYSVSGGIRDVLAASDGMAWKVTNVELFEAAQLFRETEGVDIAPAGAVATGALVKAACTGAIGPDDAVLLHITAGGFEIPWTEETIYTARPIARVKPNETESAFVIIHSDNLKQHAELITAPLIDYDSVIKR